jgi:hypothetical protein
METSSLTLRVFDGTGQVFPAGTQILVTITDGNQKQIVRQTFNAGQISLKGLPFYDNFGDNYSVIAYVEGHKQAGYAPIKLSPTAPANVDLMLIPNHPIFNFAGLTWKIAKQKMPFLAPMAGQSETDAQDRFSQLMESNGSKSLACMMNLVTAMQGIDLEGRSPASFIKQVRWDYKFRLKIDFSHTAILHSSTPFVRQLLKENSMQSMVVVSCILEHRSVGSRTPSLKLMCSSLSILIQSTVCRQMVG